MFLILRPFEAQVVLNLFFRLTKRTKSFFILPTTIKILHTNNVKVSKDQKMKKNQRLTGPSWRKGELIEGSLARFLQTPPSWTIFMVSSEIIGTTSERNEARFGCKNNEFCGGHSLC